LFVCPQDYIILITLRLDFDDSFGWVGHGQRINLVDFSSDLAICKNSLLTIAIHIPYRKDIRRVWNVPPVHQTNTAIFFLYFAVAAPTVWNTLPLDIRNSPSICCFRRHLKTFFYNLAFKPS